MADDEGFDLDGIGKAAKAIPAKAWTTLVDTACSTFKQTVAPFTATTSGIGRLIESKFDRLVDVEKVLAAETVARAAEKVKASRKKPTGTPKATVVVAAIESAANETDPLIRELWANLLAQELSAGNVHPELPKILQRLSSSDAHVLSQIAEGEKDKSVKY